MSDLGRFVKEQERVFDQVRRELRDGRKAVERLEARWCTKPWESTVASSGLASSWHAEVSGTRRDGWRHCRPVGRVAPSFHASIWEAHAI